MIKNKEERKILSAFLIISLIVLVSGVLSGCGRSEKTIFSSKNTLSREKEISSESSKNGSADDRYAEKENSVALQLYNGEICKGEKIVKKKLKEIKKSETQITWCIPSVGISKDVLIPENNIRSANRILKKKRCRLNILYIVDDAYDPNVYYSSLKKYLKKGYADIYSTGFFFDTASDRERYDFLIDNGYSADITSYVSKSKKLYNTFNSAEWEGVSKEGRIYAVPNQYFLPHRTYAAFSKKYFDKEPYFKADTLLSAVRYLKKYVSGKQETFKKSVIWNVDYFDILNSMGIFESGGLWYSHNNGSVTTFFDSADVKKILSDLGSLYGDGFLANKKLKIAESHDYLNKKIIKGDISAAFFINASCIDYIKGDYYIKPLVFYYQEHGGQNTMINGFGGKKDLSVKLITCILNDKELSRRFILGEKGRDYFLKNGYAYENDGEPLTRRWFKSTLGICDDLYNAGIVEDYGKNIKEFKKNYFSSDCMRVSKLNGFYPSGNIYKENLDSYKYMNKLLSGGDFSSRYEKFKEKFKAQDSSRAAEAEKSVDQFLKSR